MQKIALTLNHLTGKGWKSTQFHFNVDETIGVSAGRDVYATARGTAIGFIRKAGTFQGTFAHFTVDDKTHIKIIVSGDKFVKSLPTPIGHALKWE